LSVLEHIWQDGTFSAQDGTHILLFYDKENPSAQTLQVVVSLH
jgi:hypothetical protein